MNISTLLKTNWALFMILTLAVLLRFWQLGDYPVHLTNDEAALGYNAYSILKTGRDEHGELLPIIFKSFGDWKPGLYVYLTVPSVAVFGLTEFAVRFPSALAGVFAVLFVYLIGHKLFNKQIAIFTSLSLAVLPWHIHFSRGGWEANVALALLLAAILFFFKSFEKQKYLILSAIFFALTLWTYQSAKLASALVLFGFFAFYGDKLRSVKKPALATAFLFGAILSLPIILSLFNGKAGRLEVMSVFSYPRPQEYIDSTILAQEEISQHGPMFAIMHSETVNLARGVFGRYFNYFSGRFLFFEGDWSNPRHGAPDVGYLLLAQAPLLLLGALLLLRRSRKREYAFVLFWLAVSPIPAAITRDSVQGVRSLNMIIPLVFAVGFGIERVVHSLKSQNFYIKSLATVIFIGLHVYALALYLDAYYIQSPKKHAQDYLYGYKQTVTTVINSRMKYDKIVFEQSYDQPYIFFLFYGKYDPELYQLKSNFQNGANGDVGLVSNLDNVEFRGINWSRDIELPATLLVGKVTAFPADKISGGEYTVESVSYPNGTRAFLLVETP